MAYVCVSVFVCACVYGVHRTLYHVVREGVSEEINFEANPEWSEGPARAKAQTDGLRGEKRSVWLA